MPHVKGNKFKPKVDPPAFDPTHQSLGVKSASASQPQPQQQQPSKKRKRQGKATQQPSSVAEAATLPSSGSEVPTEAAGAAAKQRKKKHKQRSVGTSPHAAQGGASSPVACDVEPAIPTIVAPAPRASGAERTVATSNWSALQAKLSADKQQRQQQQRQWKKPRRTEASVAAARGGAGQRLQPMPNASGELGQATHILAMDCEMVGVGPRGSQSVLARWVCVCVGGGGGGGARVTVGCRPLGPRRWAAGGGDRHPPLSPLQGVYGELCWGSRAGHPRQASGAGDRLPHVCQRCEAAGAGPWQGSHSARPVQCCSTPRTTLPWCASLLPSSQVCVQLTWRVLRRLRRFSGA